MEATRLIAVRHGETAWNADGRIQGHLDIGLNDTGRRQAAQAAARLAQEPIDAAYASDLARAFDTAVAIAAPHGLRVMPERGLRERQLGIFQGRTAAEIEAALPEEARLWRTRDVDFMPGAESESLTAFGRRIEATVGALAARHAGQQVLLVTHGGAIDVLYRIATGQGLRAARTWSLGNAVINRLLWTPHSLTLVGWNDASHLAGTARDDAG